jgi:putative colanic acid biosynthesis glycosyltransferase
MVTILQINIVVNYSSTGRTAEGIGKIAICNGWDSYIAYGRHKRTSDSKLIKIGTDWDVKKHVLKTRLLDKHGFGSYNPTKKLIKEIETVKPDIIHLLNIHGYYLNIEVLFKYLQKKDIPVIWTLFDCWAFTGHCTYFDTIGCEKWKNFCFNCPQKSEYPTSWFIDNSKANFSRKRKLFNSIKNMRLVVHSQWLQKLVKQSFLKETPIHVIHNGIDLNTFQYSEKRNFINKRNLNNYKIILGVASEWHQRKGLNDFIELSSLIDKETRILLIGLSQRQIKSLPDNIIGIERTDSVEELAELYSSATVFVNPTWEDNFPTTNLEALACGTPVITYNTGGSPETISYCTGIIVEKGNIKGLINSINEVFSKGKIFYHQACINRAEQLFNRDDRFHDYITLFDTVLQNSSNIYSQ